MKLKFAIVIVLGMFQSVAHADIRDLRNIETPAGSQTNWIATEITHNGQGMAIKALTSQRPVEEVISFYRTTWGKPGNTPGYVENEISGWQIISQLSESHNLVVQIKPSAEGTTEGFISLMALSPVPSLGAKPFLAPANAVKVSYSRMQDKGKTGHTTILVAPSSVSSVVGFYKDNLVRDGWSLISDEYVQSSHVLKFNKQASACEVVASAVQDGSTVILINRTQGDG